MNNWEASRWRPAEGVAKKELWFLHGYASDQNDLFGLARLVPKDWNVRSLQAPRSLPQGGYAWYDLHFDANGVRQTSMVQIRETLGVIIDRLAAQPIKPVLLGFSQGGIVANALAMAYPDLVDGACSVASYAPNDWFIADLEWNAQLDLPHLAAVGMEDGVIPPSLSLPSYEEANVRGAGIEVQTFRMGHGIAPDCWQAISDWLTQF